MFCYNLFLQAPFQSGRRANTAATVLFLVLVLTASTSRNPSSRVPAPAEGGHFERRSDVVPDGHSCAWRGALGSPPPCLAATCYGTVAVKATDSGSLQRPPGSHVPLVSLAFPEIISPNLEVEVR